MTGGYLALLAKCKYTFIDAVRSGVHAKPPRASTYRRQDSYICKLKNVDARIKNPARAPVERLCWWVNLLHCLCQSSIQGTNLILFHLQRSSGVRRWVALRKKTHKSARLWSLCEEQGSTRSHTKWNFKINDWAVIYNSPPGQRKVRKHFNQPLRLCYAAMNQLFKGQNSWTAARERLWVISHQNIEHIERYIPAPMKLSFKFFWFVPDWIWVNCARLNWLKNNKAAAALWYNGNISNIAFTCNSTAEEDQMVCENRCNKRNKSCVLLTNSTERLKNHRRVSPPLDDFLSEQIHRFSSSKKSNLCDKPVLLELQQTLAGTIFSCRLLHIRCSGVSNSSRTAYVGSSQNKNYSEAHWCFWSSTTQRKWIHQGWNCRLFKYNNNPVHFHRLLLKIGDRKRKKKRSFAINWSVDDKML